MKRTPLGPGKLSLERGSTFSKPRKPLRRHRRPPRGKPTTEQIEARDEAMERGDCWLAQFADTPCSGVWELAHLIKKERLRFYGVPESAIWDERVVKAACKGHHDDLDGPYGIRLTRDQIPAETQTYAAEHGLDFLLDRLYGSREQVQTAPDIDWNAA